MSDEVSDTFQMTLAGRPIMFRRAKLGQILILKRTADRMTKQAQGDPDDEGAALTSAMVKTLDFIEGLIVSPEDREFVEERMLAGAIDYLDVMKALSGGDSPDSVADDEAPKPIKRAPRKSPKAAPVDLSDKKPAQIVAKPKTVASRGRTKR